MEANIVVLERPDTYQSKPDYDGIWKTLIEELFQEFMQFFAPDLYEEIDFSKKINFLQKEVAQKNSNKKKGMVVADQLVEVQLNSGEERWILVHIEVQGDNKKDFAGRMFRYFYRIYDKHNKEVYAIALLTDAENANFTDHFHYSFYGTKVDYKYNVYSFYNQDIKKLEDSSNPFAAAVIAGIYSSKTKKDPNQRYTFKRKLMIQALKMSTQQEDTRTYLSALFHFIDNLLQIPDELTSKLKEDIIPYLGEEASQQMLADKRKPSQTLAEIFAELKEEGREEGIGKGRKEGIEKGKKETVSYIAKGLIREGLSNEQIARITRLEIDEVEEMRKTLQI